MRASTVVVGASHRAGVDASTPAGVGASHRVAVGASFTVGSGTSQTVVVDTASVTSPRTSSETCDSATDVDDTVITSYPLRVLSWPARSHDRSSARPAAGRWPGSLLRAGWWPRSCR